MSTLSSGKARIVGLLALLAMLVPMFSTPVHSQDNGKVLRIHQTVDPDVVDPQKSSFTNEIELLSLNYEGLTKLDENLNTVPGAAESWEFNEDGTVLTFHLRQGLTYSDGSPLTAETTAMRSSGPAIRTRPVSTSRSCSRFRAAPSLPAR